MATGHKETGVRVKTEPVSPPITKMPSSGILSKFPRAVVKTELGRLPSFKPPRDLSLSGVPQILNKRITQVPNLNVGRRKNLAPATPADTSHVTGKRQFVEKSRRLPPNRKFIQEEGVFSAGLAPAKQKDPSGRGRDGGKGSPLQLEKPKLNLNKTINKKSEENKMNDLMKDDFVDDCRVMPDLSDCPKSLPLLINAKPHNFRNLEDTFNHLQVKTEKCENIRAEAMDSRSPDLGRFFSESGPARLIVMDFPDEVPVIEKKPAKDSSQELSNKIDQHENKATVHRLANIGEGHWGTLRILANGAAYILVGKEHIPVMMTRHCPRQNVMSVALDAANSKGDLVDLGRVSATLQCFSDLSPLSTVKHE